MGTWGTGISSNDIYTDVFADFFDLYDSGMSVEEISVRLIDANQETIADPDSENNFWFALAQAQWECRQLDASVFDKVRTIIETGADLEVWQQLDADEKSIAKRKLVLDKYLAKLQTERQKPRQRRKKVIRQPIFEKGDCLTFKLKDGNFGGAVVLEAVRNTEHGLNLIATTRINQPHSPTRKDFENAEVLINTFGNWKDDASIQWYSPIRHKEFAHLIEVVDNIRINIDYTQNKYRYGHIADLGIFVIESANQQFKMEETTPRPKKRQTIKELIVKNRWKFW